MEMIPVIFVFIVGLIIGSFANVVIYRVPRNLSIVKPGSRCPSCNTSIKPYDNIPLLSFLILGGKCRSCGKRIGWRYPLVELTNGLLYILAYFISMHNQPNISLMIVSIYLSTVFLIIFLIDYDFKIIPDSLSISGIIIGFGISFLPGIPIKPLLSGIGLVAGGLLFYGIAVLGDKLFKKESMGGGDIKLAAMLGAFVGWQGVLLVLCLASLLGTVIGLTALGLARDKEAARTIPFGPFLVTAGLITFYWGPKLMAAYFKMVGL
jgi:leader peptidase (prepilin peptidase) / N-methyltransferase